MENESVLNILKGLAFKDVEKVIAYIEKIESTKDRYEDALINIYLNKRGVNTMCDTGMILSYDYNVSADALGRDVINRLKRIH